MFPSRRGERKKSKSGKNPVNFLPAFYPVENDIVIEGNFTPLVFTILECHEYIPLDLLNSGSVFPFRKAF
jgi:hypothetical protein